MRGNPAPRYKTKTRAPGTGFFISCRIEPKGSVPAGDKRRQVQPNPSKYFLESIVEDIGIMKLRGIALKSLICTRKESAWTFPSDVQFLF